MKPQKALQEYGVVVALVLLIIVNAALRPSVFLNPENIRNLLNQSSFIGIVAVGMTLVIIAGGIDLSVGSIVGLTGAAAVNVLNATQPDQPTGALAAVAGGLLIGVVLGSINGLLVSVGKLAPFIATLGGLVGYRSIVLAWAEGGEIRSKSMTLYPSLGSGGLPLPVKDGAGLPLAFNWSILVWVLFAVAAGFLLEKTKFGRHMIAVGANEKAAKYSGLSVPMVRFWTYVILGLACGVAGTLLSMRLNSVASSSAGNFYELDAIAAVVIGGTPLTGGKGRIWGTVAGVLLLGVIGNMMVSFGVSNYWQGAVKGAIIVLAVLLQRGRSENS